MCTSGDGLMDKRMDEQTNGLASANQGFSYHSLALIIKAILVYLFDQFLNFSRHTTPDSPSQHQHPSLRAYSVNCSAFPTTLAPYSTPEQRSRSPFNIKVTKRRSPKRSRPPFNIKVTTEESRSPNEGQGHRRNITD